MGTLVRRRWAPDFARRGLARREWQGGSYAAYVPDLISGRMFAFPGDVAADVADATVAIQELDQRSAALTNTEALARLLLRAESVASSRIEGLEVSPQRLLRADIARREGFELRDDTATEVLANVDAMHAAIAGDQAVTLERILDVHRRLLQPTRLADHAGILRTVQNWIGGNAHNPLGAAFVPPPPEAVPALLDDLVTFCNDDQLPAVAQAAIAHAQFETIHPFVDGNGRTGRALIHMVLRRRGLAQRATPPISLVLATNSGGYIEALEGTRFDGPASATTATNGMNSWIALFAAACTQAAADASSFEQQVAKLQEDWRQRLGPVRADASVLQLLDELPRTPIITVNGAAAILGRTYRAANLAVRALVEKNILVPARAGRRDRVFEARELVDAFTGFERAIASPERDTQISAPVRAVPYRPQRARTGTAKDRP